jgi:hypothetical protein
MPLRAHLLSLPPEVFSQVTILLSRKDLRALSLLSSAARQLVLPSLFCKVHLREGAAERMKEACDELNDAGSEIKHAIK